MWIAIGIIGGILLLVVLPAIGTYNNLVNLRNQVKTAWSQIEVQLKRRWNLIPNLVNTVKGYAAHEKENFKKVIKASKLGIDEKKVEEQ